MAKSTVLFEKGTGRVLGVLRKEEVALIDEQRGMENFHVVKMNDKELLDAFEYLDLGNYVPIYVDDLIVFPHEEISFIEIADSRIQLYVQSVPKSIGRMIDNIRWGNKEEEAIVQMAIGTTLNILGQVVDMELNPEDSLNYKKYLMNVMREFGLKDDYK